MHKDLEESVPALIKAKEGVTMSNRVNEGTPADIP